MKRFFLLLLAFCLIFSLCGCSLKETVSHHRQEYIVSAIGFDSENALLQLSLEAIIINTENADAEKELKLIKGSGKTVTEAMTDALKTTSQPLMLSHCATVVIGETVDRRHFSEIMNFCRSKEKITLSAMLISTANAAKLLSCKALSSVAIGYDVISMTEQLSEHTGILFKNRIYEVESAKERQIKTFAIPYFEVNGESYSYGGLSIFNNGEPITKLDSENASIYSVITDNQSNGKAIINGEEISIESSYAVCDFEAGSRLKTILKLELKLAHSDSEKNELIKQKIQSLFKLSKELNTDIFGFGNILYHKQKTAWDTFKENYPKHYKNSVLTVVLK